MKQISCFDKKIKLNPNNACLYNNKGDCLRDLNRSNEAILCYRVSLRRTAAVKPENQVLGIKF
jgi:hypothetical protein